MCKMCIRPDGQRHRSGSTESEKTQQVVEFLVKRLTYCLNEIVSVALRRIARLAICMPILIFNSDEWNDERMKEKKIEKLYELLFRAMFENDTDAEAALSWAILQLEDYDWEETV